LNKKNLKFNRENLIHSRRLFYFSDFLSCLHLSSNRRIPMEELNKPQASLLSQYQPVEPLITTEINTPKVNFILIHSLMI
jgi:hypothetical protein